MSIENEKNGNDGTAGIPADAKFEIPQSILDFCNRVYPPHLGSAYDPQRAHLIAKRILIESPTPPQPMPSMDSILTMFQSKKSVEPSHTAHTLSTAHDPQPQQIHNEPAMNPQQTSDESAMIPQQMRDEPATNSQHNPQQPAEPSAHQPASEPTTRKKRPGPDSVIDSLSAETQQAIADLLDQYSLERVRFILSKPGPHGPAIQLSKDVLHRYRHRLIREQSQSRAVETKTFVDQLLNNPRASDDELTAAIRHIFNTRLLESVIDPAQPLEALIKPLQTSERCRQNTRPNKPEKSK
jgi:hypothetical protein